MDQTTTPTFKYYVFRVTHSSLKKNRKVDPMTDETYAKLLGTVRHVLTFVAGIAISKGYIDSESAIQIIAGITALTGFVWSWKSKK